MDDIRAGSGVSLRQLLVTAGIFGGTEPAGRARVAAARPIGEYVPGARHAVPGPDTED